MIGAIAGDIIGSVYEHHNHKSKEFELFGQNCCFTDDSVLTLAIAECILDGKDCRDNMLKFYRHNPGAGFGGRFHEWAQSENPQSYNSYGNGAAMRISPVGFACDDLSDLLKMVEKFTAVTHDHPEGIKGAGATAVAIFLARTGSSKDQIRSHIETHYSYDLSRHIDEIRPTYIFDVSCQGSVPQAIRAFLDSTGFEDAIRCAVSLGGDSDTIACITGGIAHAFYGIPAEIESRVYNYLQEGCARFNIREDYTGLARRFMQKYCQPADILPQIFRHRSGCSG